jgi:hypothetical protein
VCLRRSNHQKTIFHIAWFSVSDNPHLTSLRSVFPPPLRRVWQLLRNCLGELTYQFATDGVYQTLLKKSTE